MHKLLSNCPIAKRSDHSLLNRKVSLILMAEKPSCKCNESEISFLVTFILLDDLLICMTAHSTM